MSSMRQASLVIAFAIWASSATGPLSAQAPAGDEVIKSAAQRVQEATATVRISCQKTPEEKAGDRSDRKKSEKNAEQEAKGQIGRGHCSIVVCTGVCVAKNKIVTAVPVSSDSQIRLTFPGGEQDDARLRVVDEFSGLVLLDSPKCAARPLELAAERPAAGAAVMTAAAWGVETPLVFQGMVSGQGHALAGACFPPLLVCQLPTTDTSSGAAVVDRHGKLVGIVVGADPAQAHQSWMTYAVSVSHVQRLLRACEEREKEGQAGAVIVLKRRRGVVGWKLESADEDGIVVQQITADSPAAKAGIQKGDRVLAVDGVQIRSIYQAWSPTMCKQAGDTLTYRIRRGGETHDVTVVLGGEVQVDALPAKDLPKIVQQKLEFLRDEKGTHFYRPFRREGAGTEPSTAERIERLEAENERLKEEVKRLQGKPSGAAEELP